MTFLEAYAEFGPDTMAIADAMGIPEHKADALINAKMNREHVGPPKLQKQALEAPRTLVRFAGFDKNELPRW